MYYRGLTWSVDDDITASVPSEGEEPPSPAPAGSNHGLVFPTLAGITDIIANNIPSLAGLATSIGGSAPSSSALPPPSAPPSVDSMASSTAANIPSLEQTANAVANSATASSASAPSAVPDAHANSVSLETIVSSLANVPSFSGIISNIASPAVSSTITQTTPPAPHHPQFGNTHRGKLN